MSLFGMDPYGLDEYAQGPLQQPGTVGTAPRGGGFLARLNGAFEPFGGLGNVGLQMLANSNSGQGTGAILAQSLLQGQQQQQQQKDQELRRKYLAAQIAALNTKDTSPLVVPKDSVALDRATNKPIFSNVTPDLPSSAKEFEYAQAHGYKGSYQDFAKPPANDPAEIAEYKLAQSQGFKGTILDFQRQKAMAGRQDVPTYVNTGRGLMQWDPQKKAWGLVPGTDPQGVAGRPMPMGMVTDLSTNANALNLIDQLLPKLDPNDKSPEATAARNAFGGTANYVGDLTPFGFGDNVKNKINPTGTDARAILTNLNSAIIKDRSGAAVTVSEWARQRGFLPTDRDAPEVVRKKLTNLRKAIADNQQYIADVAESQGYRAPPLSVMGSGPKQRGATGGWSVEKVPQ